MYRVHTDKQNGSKMQAFSFQLPLPSITIFHITDLNLICIEKAVATSIRIYISQQIMYVL